jgi:predicted NodU family carbamoyl transferase
MNIIGVNTSHDTSVASITDDTIDFVFDEARFRRKKYWTIEDGEDLQCVVQRNISKPDKLIFATFDRRVLSFTLPVEEYVFNRVVAEELANMFREKQLSAKRILEIQKEYPKLEFNIDNLNDDNNIAEMLSKQFDMRDFTLHPEHHHLYHAECVFALSPWKDEECIAIVWDGGGSQPYFNEWPNYQEMETIYHCVPGETPKKVWQRLSNYRQLNELGYTFPNQQADCLFCMDDEVVMIDDAEIIFSSRPSSGQNFSALSACLGADSQGRAAGKIMGMASYGNTYPNFFTQYSVTQQCEQESLTNSLNIIHKAQELIPNTNKILLSGGYSLNCTNNYHYLKANPDYEFFVDPIPHDGGTALGAALWLRRKG